MGRLRGIHEGERQKTGNFLGVLISQLRVQLPAPPFGNEILSRNRFYAFLLLRFRSSHFSRGNFHNGKIMEKFITNTFVEKETNYEILKCTKLNIVA